MKRIYYKNSFFDVHDWALCIAQDCSGTWFEYDNLPKLNDSIRWWDGDVNGRTFIIKSCNYVGKIDWNKSLFIVIDNTLEPMKEWNTL